MIKDYYKILDIDDCIDEFWQKRELPVVSEVLKLSKYTEKDIRSAIDDCYYLRVPKNRDAIEFLIEDRWMWKLLYSYHYFKNDSKEERVVAFLSKYKFTFERIESMLRKHPINFSWFYFLRSDIIKHYHKLEGDFYKKNNKELLTARNLIIKQIPDEYTNKLSCLKISKSFAESHMLESLGVHCIEVKLKEDEMLMGDNSVVQIGTEIKAGDVLVEKYFVNNHKKRINTSVYVDAMSKGVVVDVVIKSRSNGDLSENTVKEYISIYIEFYQELLLGDVLYDKLGNKGIIVDIVDVNDADIISNSQFDGEEVCREINSKSNKIFYARSSGNVEYTKDNGIPCGTDFTKPVVLSINEIEKFVKNGRFSALQNLYSYLDFRVREKLIINNNKTKNLPNLCLGLNIDKLIHVARSLGSDIIFTVRNEERKDYENIINNEDLKVNVTRLTDKKIIEYSNGEVTNHKYVQRIFFDNAYIKNSVSDPQIFGDSYPENSKCSGHISLPISYPNCMFPESKLHTIYIYPIYFRRLIGNVNELLSRILISKDEVIKFSNEKTFYKNNTVRNLNACVEELYLGRTISGYRGLIEEYWNTIKNHIINVPIDCSASLRAIPCKEVKAKTCVIPWIVGRIVFNQLIQSWVWEKFKKYENPLKFIDEHIADLKFREELNAMLAQEEVYVLSSKKSGEIEELSVQISFDNNISSCILLNPIDYNDVNTDIDVPIHVFYKPISSNISNIPTKVQKVFFNFIKMLDEPHTIDDIRILLQGILCYAKKNDIVDTLSFCLLTGRRYGVDREKVDIRPFVEQYKKEVIEDFDINLLDDIENLDLFADD